MKLKLSISLLVSDRTETLKKCLHSLLPLLKAVPSELIIVYTGKREESLNIARQYTDHIIPFTWCDDFSAARNAGLKEATGEWFLYIDDDEWFEDCTEMVQFFQSGECEEFQSASYIVRNYHDMNGENYSDVRVMRMLKRLSQTKFVGKIHEGFNSRSKPIKYFKTFVHHYSYAISTKSGRSISSERNIPLLLKEVQEHPEQVKNYLQLAQEYVSGAQYEKGNDYCHKVLTIAGEKISGNSAADWARAFIVYSLVAMGEGKEAIRTGMQILEEGYIGELGAMHICVSLLPSCSVLKRYEEGKKSAALYFKHLDYLTKHPHLWDKQQILEVNHDNIEKSRVCVITNALICAAATHDYKMAETFLSCFKWTNEKQIDSIYKFFEDWKKDFATDMQQVLECFASLSIDDTYILFQKALLAEMNQDEKRTKALYLQCGKSDNYYVRYQAVLMAVRRDYSLPEFMEYIDLDAWRLCVAGIAEKGLFEDASFEDYNRFTMTIQLLFYDYPIHRLVLEQKVLPRFMLQNRKAEGEFVRILHRYCQAVIELNRTLYRDELFEASMSFCLPIECRAAMAIDDALVLLDQGSCSNGIKALKMIVTSYPGLASLIDKIITNVEKEYLKSEEPKNPEFEKLGNQIKLSLKQLIETGQYSSALPIAEKLCELLPEDIEIVRWKQKILLKLSE